MERKTYRISKQQHARLKRMKQHAFPWVYLRDQISVIAKCPFPQVLAQYKIKELVGALAKGEPNVPNSSVKELNLLVHSPSMSGGH